MTDDCAQRKRKRAARAPKERSRLQETGTIQPGDTVALDPQSEANPPTVPFRPHHTPEDGAL